MKISMPVPLDLRYVAARLILNVKDIEVEQVNAFLDGWDQVMEDQNEQARKFLAELDRTANKGNVPLKSGNKPEEVH